MQTLVRKNLTDFASGDCAGEHERVSQAAPHGHAGFEVLKWRGFQSVYRPQLNLYRGLIAAVRDLLDEGWLTTDSEATAIRFATVELAQRHVAEVKARRLPEVEKVQQEVRARLKKEIN